MKTSDKGRKFIEGFEGLILQAYDDASDHILHQGDTVHGTMTIGYGHTDAAGQPTVFIGQTMGQSSALTLLNQGKYAEAADHLTLYNHAGGKVLAGLTRRRQAEKDMFLAKSNLAAGPVTAVVVASGTAAAASGFHSPLIFLGIIAASLIIGVAVHMYANRKVTNVV